MPPAESEPNTSESLRVQDRLGLELTPLSEAMVAAVQAGRLGASTQGGDPEGASSAASVDAILRSLPADQRPEGPMAEALRVVDAKLDRLMALMEEIQARGADDGPAPRDVMVGLEGLELWSGAEETTPATGDWLWLRLHLPGRPHTVFEVPVAVTAVTASGESERVALRFLNVTAAEERVLSRYIFRRHRQEVRRQRNPDED